MKIQWDFDRNYQTEAVNAVIDLFKGQNSMLHYLKTDLAEYGVAKYKIKYGSGFSNRTGNNGNNNFCANCGAKLDKGSKFCSECGTKVE